MNRWISAVFVVGLLGALALVLGIVLHPLAVDDAFITYRYAHNLAAGHGFAYNPERPVLSTTAPLYALLLSIATLVGFDLPSFANALSAIAVWVGALLILVLGNREKAPSAGALAALFYVLNPLLWLSLGLETAVFLVLALGAIVVYRSGRLYWTAALLALATLTRGDALILTAVIATDYLLGWLGQYDRPGFWRASDIGGPSSAQLSHSRARRFGASKDLGGLSPAIASARHSRPNWREALGAAGVYVAVTLPLLVWLTWQFGSPLPATLGAKVAQSELGVTGFYAHTNYLQGLGILVRARLAQSWLYVLFIPAVVVGLVAMWRRGWWVRLVVAWGTAHLAGYTVLGVTPYYWHYAPTVPGLVCSTALGVVEGARWLAGRASFRRGLVWGLGWLWVAALVAALGFSDWAVVQALDGPVPPPEDLISKVLPEAKVDVYKQAGRWLHDHTPSNATVGVTEVGIMGFYAERSMVDFLGLLEPDVAEALARGDVYWALLRFQPDYLALTAISPMYAYDLRADPWFQAAYVPIQTMDDPRFWGSPVTIYERLLAREPLVGMTAEGLPDGATVLGVDLGQIRLLGAVTGGLAVQPGDVLGLTLYWQAQGAVDRDYTVFVHLLGEHDRVIAQRDAAPGLGARPTSQWRPGQVIVDPYLLALPEAAYAPDQAVWEVGLYEMQTGERLQAADGGDNVRFGTVSVESGDEPLRLNFGRVALTGYELDRLALSRGETLHVRLRWDRIEPVHVTVQLVDDVGKVVAQTSGSLSQEVYLLTLDAEVQPGACDLEVSVTNPQDGQLLPLLGADGQPRSEGARLTKIRLYSE